MAQKNYTTTTTQSGQYRVTLYAPAPAPVAAPRPRNSQDARTLTASRLHRKKSIVPYVRLSGAYLAAAGITPGTRLTVTVTPQGVTITPRETTP